MASLTDINGNYNNDRSSYFRSNPNATEDEWAGTTQAKGYNTQLIDYYKNNPNEGITQANALINDPNQPETSKAFARQRLSALQPSTSAPSTTAAVGFGGGSGAGSSAATNPAPAINPAYVPPPYAVKDDSVESFLPGLLDKSGALMTKARGDAMRTANRRGLQNSSIAAGEGTKAALGVVVPMASQDASQTAQKNLAAQGFGYNAQLQGQQIAGQTNIAQMQITADVQKQREADAAAMERLKQQGYSEQQIESMRETNAMTVLKQQGFNDQQIELMREASQKELTGQTLTSEEKRAADQLNNAKSLQNHDSGAGTMVSERQRDLLELRELDHVQHQHPDRGPQQAHPGRGGAPGCRGRSRQPAIRHAPDLEHHARTPGTTTTDLGTGHNVSGNG
jgi:hypothetical protein